MEKSYIRQCVGIDVSQNTLDIAFSVLSQDFKPKLLATTKFDNSKSGITKLMQWIERKKLKHLPLQVVLEATGIYHEQLAYTLTDSSFNVTIVMPTKIKKYFQSTDIRSITDIISAKLISEFGLIHNLENWQKPDPVFLSLKALTREREMKIKERTQIKNQKHTFDRRAVKDKGAISRADRQIKLLDKLVKEIEQDIFKILDDKKNEWLKAKIKKICTVKGLATLTVVTVISETDGFNLIQNSRQLVCFSGYDVVFKESGTSVKMKTRISHKGNKHIRKALYFPSLCAKRHESKFTDFYNRLYAKQQVKMKSYVAIQRKLLILIYTLWNKDETYNPNFVWTGKAETGSGGNQPVRNSLSDWNGPGGGLTKPSLLYTFQE